MPPDVGAMRHCRPTETASMQSDRIGERDRDRNDGYAESLGDPSGKRARRFVRRALSNGSRPWRGEHPENGARQQELRGCREAPRAMPAAAVVEEFSSARAHEGEDVLEVGRGARGAAERRWIERASPRGEEEDAHDATANLETTRADVPVRQAVACEVEDRPEEERRESRPAGSASRGARCHVERDDHRCSS
jgi:hypothetical protein